MYKDNILGSVRGGLSSGVPGDVRGLEYLHNKYGVRTISIHNLDVPHTDQITEASVASSL